MAQTKKRALDIFSVLTQVSKKDALYYDKLTDEERKQLHPFVVMRWLTGTKDARQIYFLNELANRFVFALASHKELLFNLLCVATSGKPQRYQWKKAATRSTSSLPTCLQVIREYYKYNSRQAADALGLLTDEDVIAYAEELGLQKEDMSKVLKELKTRT